MFNVKILFLLPLGNLDLNNEADYTKLLDTKLI